MASYQTPIERYEVIHYLARLHEQRNSMKIIEYAQQIASHISLQYFARSVDTDLRQANVTLGRIREPSRFSTRTIMALVALRDS